MNRINRSSFPSLVTWPRRTVILLVALVCPAISGWPQSAGQKFLPAQLPASVQGLKPIGRLSASENLRVAIGLPLRNRQALADLLQQLYDPGSTNYHQYLTPAQFNEKFGPSEEDYQAVIHFAKTNGLEVAATLDSDFSHSRQSS
jgi:subtilase family serine protease